MATQQENMAAMRDALAFITAMRQDMGESLDFDSSYKTLAHAFASIALEVFDEIDRLGGEADQVIRDMAENMITNDGE